MVEELLSNTADADQCFEAVFVNHDMDGHDCAEICYMHKQRYLKNCCQIRLMMMVMMMAMMMCILWQFLNPTLSDT
jgi:hypothetical protein